MTVARDIDDPQRLAELRWNAAIRAWEVHDTRPLQALIGSMPIPDFAVDFLRDLVAGNAKRPPGAASARAPQHERDIAADVYAKWEVLAASPKSREGTPKARAEAAVAEKYNMTPDQVRHVVAKVSDEGLTRNVWRQYLKGPPEAT